MKKLWFELRTFASDTMLNYYLYLSKKKKKKKNLSHKLKLIARGKFNHLTDTFQC
jgi:hypothetical protein